MRHVSLTGMAVAFVALALAATACGPKTQPAMSAEAEYAVKCYAPGGAVAQQSRRAVALRVYDGTTSWTDVATRRSYSSTAPCVVERSA